MRHATLDELEQHDIESEDVLLLDFLVSLEFDDDEPLELPDPRPSVAKEQGNQSIFSCKAVFDC